MSRNLFIIVLLIITPFCGWGQVDTIADQKLQEVVIMAKLPTVEMKPGKMTYRLDASIHPKPRECLRRVDQFAGSRDTKTMALFS